MREAVRISFMLIMLPMIIFAGAAGAMEQKTYACSEKTELDGPG